MFNEFSSNLNFERKKERKKETNKQRVGVFNVKNTSKWRT